MKFASPSCVCFISFGFLLATICVWVWMVCSLHSVTTGSRDRANVALIIIIIIDQAGEVANLARGPLNRENKYFRVFPRSRLRIWSRETRSAVRSRVSLLIFQPQAESGAYSRNSSRFTWRRSMCPLILTG